MNIFNYMLRVLVVIFLLPIILVVDHTEFRELFFVGLIYLHDAGIASEDNDPQEIKEWLSENNIDYFSPSLRVVGDIAFISWPVYFRKKEDATLFKLTWG